MRTTSRRKHIENTINNIITNFLYYDRKGNSKLPRGAIEEAVKAGEITEAEIVALFAKHLANGLR